MRFAVGRSYVGGEGPEFAGEFCGVDLARSAYFTVGTTTR